MASIFGSPTPAVNRYGGSSIGIAKIVSGTPNGNIGTTKTAAATKPGGSAKSNPVTPSQTPSGAGGTTIANGSSSGNSNIDPVAAAYYGNEVSALQSLLGGLGPTQDQGVANIRNSANKSLNAVNTAQSDADSNYALQRKNATTNKENSLNSVDQNVADTVGSFLRLVGASHAGDSAFAKEFVPMATAKEGTQQRQQVFNSYGQDMGNLDTSQKTADRQYDTNRSDINDKLNSDILTFLSNMAGQRDQINGQIRQAQFYQNEAQGGSPEALTSAMTPYTESSADRVAAFNQLVSQYANPTYTVNPVTVSVPDISSYLQDPLTAKLSSENPDTPLAYLPYLPQLKKSANAAVATA